MANKKPRRGSTAWYEERMRDPEYVQGRIVEIADRAARGSEQSIKNLFEWLASYPEMRSAVRYLDDLATQVERAWVDRMAGASVLFRKALGDDVAAMRAELLAPRRRRSKRSWRAR